MANTAEQVNTVSRMLNSYSFNPAAFCKNMQNEHRTLQQSFTRLCVEWLKTCASDEYLFDERNRASHEVAKRMVEAGGNTALPFI